MREEVRSIFIGAHCTTRSQALALNLYRSSSSPSPIITSPPAVRVMKAGAAGLFGMRAKASVGAAKVEAKVEKTVFELKLESYEAPSKIKIIKDVRSFTDLGLKEAKDLLEKKLAVLKKGVSKDEGEQIIEKMKALGAKVVLE